MRNFPSGAHAREQACAHSLRIGLLSSVAGSGKTFACVGHAAELARAGEWVMISQPSKALINQTLRGFQENAPDVAVHVFHQDVTPQVVASVVRHTRTAVPGQGQVVIISHAAYERLPYVDRRGLWHLIVDEVPTIDWSVEFTLTEHRDMLLNLFSVDHERSKPNHARLAQRERLDLRKIARNKSGEQVRGLFQATAAKLHSEHWHVYALAEQLASFQAKGGRLSLFGVLQPSFFRGFKSVVIMGAFARDSLMYRAWTGLESPVRFVEAPFKARWEKHSNGHLADIYFLTDHDWSKRLRARDAKEAAENASVHELLVAHALELFGGEPFAYMCNNGDEAIEGGVRLPNTSHGLNEYTHLHNALITSALNPTPAHIHFVAETLGVSPAEQQFARFRQSAYQAVSRISLRDPASTDRKRIVVPDRGTAEWLATAAYEGATVNRLCEKDPLGPAGSKTAAIETADRVAAHRQRKREALIRELTLVRARSNEALYSSISPPLLPGPLPDLKARLRAAQAQTADRPAASDKDHGTGGWAPPARPVPHQGSFYEHVEQNVAAIELRDVNGEDLLAELREAASRKRTKAQAGLISPGQFHPTRAKANVVSASNVWLDFDGGDLAPERFAELFPQLRMACYSTSSSTKDAPRWRAVILTDGLMGPETYAAVVGVIVQRLNKAGYVSAKYLAERPQLVGKRLVHGLDEGKLGPSSMFYLPVVAAAGESHSFFHDFAGPERRPINVLSWVKGSVMRDRPPANHVEAAIAAPAEIVITGRESEGLRRLREALRAERQRGGRDTVEQRVAQAVARYKRNEPACGHTAFFGLFVSLCRLGLDRNAVEDHLHRVASTAQAPAKRRPEIARLMTQFHRHAQPRAA